jgi:hypothetical protein
MMERLMRTRAFAAIAAALAATGLLASACTVYEGNSYRRGYWSAQHDHDRDGWRDRGDNRGWRDRSWRG